MTKWVVKPLVPEPVYTDRAELLEYFYHAALEAAHRRTWSTMLLGTRRMGKTEIFKRVVNRLFFEQDPQAPHAVLPVYYSFSDKQTNRKEFALGYMKNFLYYYLAFYTRQPEIISYAPSIDELVGIARDAHALLPVPATIDRFFSLYDAIERDKEPEPEARAVEGPRRISDVDDTTIVMFLDEFQNTRLPQDGFDIVGCMQEAVESPTCPHFVTGSAMSILAREIIGRGALFGRFRNKPIKPMSAYWGAELALKAARYYHAEIPELMAPVIAERCGGNPFYINAVAQQAADRGESLENEEQLNRILAIDISSGFIWGELHDQVTRWIERLNEYKITKWVLYLSALEEAEKISIERIRQELKTREGLDVAVDVIRDVLVRLSRGDLVEYLELGGWFRKVSDPILLEFLKIWGRIEVAGHKEEKVQEDLRTRYALLKRRINEYKGYLAEVFMSQVLLSGQGKTLPGQYFHSQKDVTIPDLFSYVHHRMRLSSGPGREIDLIGAAAGQIWVCQSKWLARDKVNVKVAQELLAQADMVRQDDEITIISMTMWLFAATGLTAEAERLAQEHGILWSSIQDLNQLLNYLGLRQLPDLVSG